jgi:hypothetical protein
MRAVTKYECPNCHHYARNLELVEPGGCLFLFLLVALSIGFIVGADLAIRQLSPSTGLWSWTVGGWPVHGFGWMWHFFIVYAISATAAALIIRYVFRLNTKKNAYIECPSCKARFERG